MARLSTQPAPPTSSAPQPARAVPLRSGFVALPLATGRAHLFARVHHGHGHGHGHGEEDAPPQTGTGTELFVTGFPAGTSAKGLKAAVGRVWDGTGVAVREVRMLDASSSDALEGGATTTTTTTLLAAERAAQEAQDEEDAGGAYTPLLDPSLLAATYSGAPHAPASSSALVSFAAPPPFPPPPYDPATALSLPAPAPFLSAARARHALARPHRSQVIAHADAWMAAFDRRRSEARPVGYTAEAAAGERAAAARAAKKAAKLARRRGKAAAADEVKPGSAAEALARHAALRERMADPAFDPDALDEGEWTTVQRGGKHGKSLLPAGVEATVQGYGGTSVKVARKRRPGEQLENKDAGIKKIVGDGFYRFNLAEGRRQELANLKSRFEEDKRRVDRMRGAGAGGRGGRGGFGSGGGRGRGSGRFKPY
ncbi:hypothetical protein JCM3770_001135 [Rhodotorula araucariae]